ncbi:DUF362 domain-containing protein [Candidatus Hecatella orcuttiae]|jgi:uncharacterized protein (DUF362 family)|uniref:DUF362 domain-containing protein n=1 Tax=Candidatus Hecatella orcuttiae TaxID=1935119 RepID=UPI0028682677|nr:DUF362 domain-containing protein [Candidatus Hecatella orcuttiae]
MSRVAISKLVSPVDESKIFDAVKSVLDKLGGIEKFVSPGEMVLIKPNFVSPRPPPVTTDIRVIKALALQIKETGAKPIIGEGSSAMTHWWREGMTTEDVMDLLGVSDMAKEIGVELIPFDRKGVFKSRMTLIPDAVLMKKAEIAELALEADKIIPLPVLKTSMEGGGITCCIKVLHALTNAQSDRLRWHRSDLWQKLIDLFRLVKPKIPFCLVDGLVGMEGDGPIHGTPVNMNLILAGDDPVSTDAIAAKIIGFEYPHREIGPIALAHSQGLGMGDPSQIEVMGEKVDEVKKRFLMASCEIITPPFENVLVYEGATCRGCKAWIKFLLYMLRDTGIFEDLKRLDKKLFFFTGLEPPFPTDLEELRELSKKGVILVYGDCSTNTTKHSYWVLKQGELKGKIILIPGCPPFDSAQQATQIRDALGLETTEKEEEAFKYVPT